MDYTIYIESKVDIKGAQNIERGRDKEVNQRSRNVVWVRAVILYEGGLYNILTTKDGH